MLNLKDKIIHCLQKFISSRNSDIDLTLNVWREFHNSKIVIINGEEYVKLKEIINLPREDNIKRIRAKIQNELHLFPPTDPEIIKKREVLEEKWRIGMSRSNPVLG